MKLLTMASANTKMSKNETSNYHSAILHLAPYNLSGYQVCPAASQGCAKACLNSAGRGRFDNVQQARARKTKLFYEAKDTFINMLIDDIGLLVEQANRLGKVPTVRLNGTSDIDWENVFINDFCNIFEYWPQVQFYDYTKRPDRLLKNKNSNYHLTFSNSESNDVISRRLLNLGYNIAVVFDKLPDFYWNHKVVNGDLNDLRFLDNQKVIVGLTAKGKAKNDKTNFVKHVNDFLRQSIAV
jgi:hypothetical protein